MRSLAHARRTLTVVLAVVGLMLVSIGPSGARPSFEGCRPDRCVGEQIRLDQPPPTVVPDSAFNIRHGWHFESGREMAGRASFGFVLWADGTLIEPDFVINEFPEGWLPGPGSQGPSKRWVHNFPDGLPAGEHSFVGEWYATCAWGVGNGYVAGPCESPFERTLVYRAEVTLAFVAP